MSQEHKIIAGIIATTIFFVMVMFFVIALAAYFHKRKKALLLEKKALQSTWENELLKTKLEVQEQAFTDISREIHDNIGQALSFIRLNIATIDLNKQADAQEKLQETKFQLSQTIQDLRDLSKILNTDFIASTGLVAGIRRQVEMLNKTGVYHAVFNVTGEPEYYASQQELVLYRVVQESMGNFIKHAQAEKITIELAYVPGRLIISIMDDGVGFDIETVKAAQSSGIGLTNIASRMQLINGKATINSQPGAGTSIILELLQNS